ncbi:metallophosphoesterase [Acidocella sp.]|uniref:metallophosphoesterase n=1 Tax=Acidocella sp. TaxID=50710 RepID=UPI003CFDB967
MIRVIYMSDLHIEMQRRKRGWRGLFFRRSAPAVPTLLDALPPPDLIVLAGDIHNGLLSVAYADSLAKRYNVPVALVAGNHEYYFHDITHTRAQLRAAAAATQGRVRFLDNEAFTLEVREERLHVLGATLWTDFNLDHDVAASSEFALERMNDYRVVNDQTMRLTPKLTRERHFESRAWLHTTMARLKADDASTPRLIVTHHAPAAAFLGTREGPIGPAYASDLLPEFAPYAPAFWVHGHTHYRHETFSSGIWVVSAPRGYARERDGKNTPYEPGILEI